MTRQDMPTLMQKIRLAIRGWNRRREEREQEFLARNTVWAPASAGAGGQKPASAQRAVDLEGLTVAYLDDSGQIAYYLDMESGEVIDVRDGRALDATRYRRVPARSREAEVEDRRAFIATLDPSSTRERLTACIGLAEAFRRTLATDRNVERAWYNFKSNRALAAVQAWLREIGLA